MHKRKVGSQGHVTKRNAPQVGSETKSMARRPRRGRLAGCLQVEGPSELPVVIKIPVPPFSRHSDLLSLRTLGGPGCTVALALGGAQ